MYLYITVKPRSRKNEILINPDGTLKIKIKAEPIEGKGNKALVSYLSEVLKIPKSFIKVEKGLISQHKRLSIEAEEDYVRRILQNYR